MSAAAPVALLGASNRAPRPTTSSAVRRTRKSSATNSQHISAKYPARWAGPRRIFQRLDCVCRAPHSRTNRRLICKPITAPRLTHVRHVGLSSRACSCSCVTPAGWPTWGANRRPKRLARSQLAQPPLHSGEFEHLLYKLLYYIYIHLLIA